jgi:AcrR family transcriptional regulator
MSVELDTRAKLLNATIDAITAGGEGSVRVSTVAAAVGVREPSVYHFFKNREALVEAAQIERYRRSYLEMILPFEAAALISDTWADFERAVRKIFAAVYSPERAELRSIRMNVMGAAQSSPAIAAAVIEINHETAESLRCHGPFVLGHRPNQRPGYGRNESLSSRPRRLEQGINRGSYGHLPLQRPKISPNGAIFYHKYIVPT